MQIWLKNRRVLLTISGALVVLLGLAAFTQFSAMSYADLVARLRTAGATVTEAGYILPDNSSGREASTPLLVGKGRVLMINGERVEVFEYVTPLLAAADASRISPDGDTFRGGIGPLGGSAASVDWIATPHFYKSGRLIVQYIGRNVAVTGLLARALGLQFAGGQ